MLSGSDLEVRVFVFEHSLLKKKKDYSLLLKSIYLLTYSVCTSLSSGAQGLRSCLQHVGSSSLTRGGTQAPALGAWSLSR